MLSAKEACELSESNMETALNAELHKLENTILRATSRGDTFCFIYDKISAEAKGLLEKLGYNVIIHYTLKDGYSVTISWKDGCN